MKLRWFVVLGAMVFTSLLAQQVTNPPSATSAGTNAPAAAASKKKAPKKTNPPRELRTVPLVPGPAVVDASHVNVRGQPKLKSEVVTRLNKGQPVTVIEEIVKNNSGPDEPSAWAKISLPTNAHVWVHTSYIDPTNKTVLPKKLNVRSGPGENFSVLGQLLRGDAVKEVGTKGTWLEVEAPTNAYAFVAAQFLKQEAAGTTPSVAEAPATMTETNAVSEPPTVVAAATETPATTTNAPTELTTATNELANASTNAPTEPPIEEPPPKRIVQREGIVRGTTSIQAPTKFALYSLQNSRLINYLYTTSENLDLRRYKGLHIVVTGEEGLEERWGNTPVITIQKIQTLDE